MNLKELPLSLAHTMPQWARRAAATLMLVMSVPSVLASNSAGQVLQAWQAMSRHMEARDFKACVDQFDAVRELLATDVSEYSLIVWTIQAQCRVDALPRATLAAEDIAAMFEPMLMQYEAMAPSHPAALGLIGRAQLNIWATQFYAGFAAAANAKLDAWLTAQLSHFTTPGQQSRALAILEGFARAHYGSVDLTIPRADRHARMAQVLGEEARPSLILLQARIFSLRRMGRVHDALQLMDDFERIVTQHHPGDERLLMSLRSERAPAYSAVGRLADAFEESRLLLEWQERRHPPSHIGQMRAAYNLAHLAIQLSDLDAAEKYALRSIAAAQQAEGDPDHVEQAFARILLAYARFLRDGDAAAQVLNDALKALPRDVAVHAALLDLAQRLKRPADDPLKKSIGATYSTFANYVFTPDKAERALQVAIELATRPLGDPEVLPLGAAAVARAHAQHRPAVDAQLQFAWARHLAAHNADGAIWLYKRAAQSVVRLRQEVAEAAPGRQAAWMTRWDEPLREFVGLLIDQGRLVEAEQAIEILREEELADFRRRSRGHALASTRSRVSQVSFTAAEAERNLQVAPAIDRLRASADSFQRRQLNEIDYNKRLIMTDAAMDSNLALLASQFREQALLTPEPALNKKDAQQGARRLPPGVARLSAFQRPDKLDLVLQVGTRLHRRTLPLAAADVNREVHRLRAALSRPGTAPEAPPSLQVLHDWLIKPFAEQGVLQSLHELRLAMDGSLRYVPFAALSDGSRFLAERFSISVEALGTENAAPGPVEGMGRVTNPPIRTAKPLRVAAFGRSLPDADHEALPGVREELNVVAALRGADVLAQLDQQFDAAALRRALDTSPGIVHLASHFVLDPAGEEASYLKLGNGDRLSLRELRQMPWQGVQLAVLSACDSALSLQAGVSSNGQEMAGFAASLRAAGVRQVLATLWRVDDGTTAQWMRAFYRPWQSDGASQRLNARHLAQTQRDWLRSHRGTALAHPYYWAAFAWMEGQ